jgi:hypothetical protein
VLDKTAHSKKVATPPKKIVFRTKTTSLCYSAP